MWRAMLVVSRVADLRKLYAPACFFSRFFSYVIVVVLTLAMNIALQRVWTKLWRF